LERLDSNERRGASAASVFVTATIVVAFLAQMVISLGPGGTKVAAAGIAYQYQYPATVSGSGTIPGINGSQVSFSVSVKFDASGTTGSCSVHEPATRTKVKCLGVTSLNFAVFSADKIGAQFSGPATVNGVATTYQITTTDLGTPGKDTDGFFVKTGTGFQRSGALTSGNISIHGVS
jgi:hypothetical protein